jgi:hypothetical protein
VSMKNILYRNTNDETLKNHHRLYCKILKDETQKMQHCNRQVLNCSNKIRTIWDITKSVTGNFSELDSIQELKVNGGGYQ